MSNSINFSDIQSHWAEKCIKELAKREFISGYPNGKFLPEKTITRAEAAAMFLLIKLAKRHSLQYFHMLQIFPKV